MLFWQILLCGLSLNFFVTIAVSLQSRLATRKEAHRDYEEVWWGTDRIQLAGLPLVGGIDFCRQAVDASLNSSWPRSASPRRTGLSFAIGITRNPFNYYANMWTRLRDGKLGLFDAALLPEFNVSWHLPDQSEKDKFGFFVRRISNERLGLLSLRMYGAYMNGQDFGQNYTLTTPPSKMWGKGTVDAVLKEISDVTPSFGADSGETYPASPAVRPGDVVKAMESTLREYAPGRRGPIDCFVYVESIAVDMWHCLKRFEKEHLDEDDGDGVQWDQFTSFAGSNGWLLGPDKASCDALYDDDLRAFVRRSDRPVLEFFRYEDECSGDTDE